jgi:fructose-1,6-bisphosphatase/inositol monophosphatase family enzyme
MPGLSTDAVLDLLREVAAEVITPRFRSLAAGEVMEKNPGDLVTVADREAEELITARLLAAYPDAVVLGEEAFAADHSVMERYLVADHAFTVDPVDGTKNFVHGSPDHAVMVAETIGGETVRGWIWQPEHEVAWVAELGSGTWRDGTRVHTTPVPEHRDPQGVTSMWAMREQRLGDLPAMRLSWVCCGVDYPKLVEGATDYIVYSRSNPWDHAPGSLLVTEAGGSVGHPDGTPYGPRSLRPGLVVAVDRPTYAVVQRRVAATFAR